MTRVYASRVESDGSVARVAPSRSAREPEQIGPVLIADSLSGYRVVADSLGVISAPTLDNGLSRVAHAWALQNFRLLTGELPHPVARIITHRDLRDRVDAVAPFFVQGTSISPLVVADSLYWVDRSLLRIQQLSVERARFARGTINLTYLQHAAVSVTNALTGATWIVVDSVQDPITESWVERLPGARRAAFRSAAGSCPRASTARGWRARAGTQARQLRSSRRE